MNFTEDRYNEQFQQGMEDQFECILDSELVHRSQYVDEYCHRMYDRCQHHVQEMAAQHPYVAQHVARYATLLRKHYNGYMGSTGDESTGEQRS